MKNAKRNLKTKKLILIIIAVMLLGVGYVVGRDSVKTGLNISSISDKTKFVSGNYMVKRVLDADTIDLEGGVRVRYEGIDGPELNEPFGITAYELNRSMVEGKNAYIELADEAKGKYGRILGFIWVDNTLVNKRLVEEGYAKVFIYQGQKSKYHDELIVAQERARDNHLGTWIKEWE